MREVRAQKLADRGLGGRREAHDRAGLGGRALRRRRKDGAVFVLVFDAWSGVERRISKRLDARGSVQRGGTAVVELPVFSADFVLNQREMQPGHQVAQAQHDQQQRPQRVEHQPNSGRSSHRGGAGCRHLREVKHTTVWEPSRPGAAAAPAAPMLRCPR